MTRTRFVGCFATSRGSAWGGALAMTPSGVTCVMRDCQIERCWVAANGTALGALSSLVQENELGAHGGALYFEGVSLELAGTTLSDCTSSSYGGSAAYGGGIFLASGFLVLSNETQLSGNVAKKGSAFYVSAGVLRHVLQLSTLRLLRLACSDSSAAHARCGPTGGSYVLPAPLGRWVAATPCEVYYKACPPRQAGCDRKALGLSLYQSCNHQDQPWLLGRNIETAAEGATDVESYPYPCQRGLYGNSTEAREQSSPLCSGRCPAGSLCAGSATVIPSACPSYSYCEEGSVLPQLCPQGTYSNRTGLASAAECSGERRGTRANTNGRTARSVER